MALKKFIGISGSLRVKSSNTGLLRVMQNSPTSAYTLTILDYSALPLYDQDVEDGGNPVSVDEARAAIAMADGIIFACPEYNGYFSAALKNLIDWGTRKSNIWANKSCLIVSAGGGGGGIRACKQLTALLTDIKAHVMPDPDIHVKIFSQPPPVDFASGTVTDSTLGDKLRNAANDFASWHP